MRKIPFKNYIILVIILVLVFFLTTTLSNIYTNRIQLKTNFFESFRKIDIKDFSQYIIENPDTIIYISSEFNKNNMKFENDFKKILNKNNLHDYVVCIDKTTLTEEYEKQINESLNADIKFEYQPIILVVEQKEIKNIVYVDLTSYDANTIIDYKVFK